MNAHEYAVKQAQKAAASDHANGLKCDPARHDALTCSAWASWYYNEYQRLEKELKNG